MDFENYQIIDDAILIPRSELEKVKKHYDEINRISFKENSAAGKDPDDWRTWFYNGFRGCLDEILSHFDKK